MSTNTNTPVMTPEAQLAMAFKLASEHHLNQKDKAGKPYILHPVKVMHYLKTDDYELMSVAMMHDLLEDTPVTKEALAEYGFSSRVIDAVSRLTKLDNQTPEEYLRAVSASRDATLVKLADLRHNSDIRRLKGLTDKDLLRMRKYHDMHTQLKKVLELHNQVQGIR